MGPDEIPIEFFKELDDKGLESIKQIMDIWWEEEEVRDDLLQASIALIYKKGIQQNVKTTDQFHS